MWTAFTFILFTVALAAADFPIGFTKAPPPDGKTPSGADGYRELVRNGAVLHRLGGKRVTEAEIQRTMERSAEAGMRVALFPPDLTAPADAAAEENLRRFFIKYRKHPALAYCKGV